jgi:N-acyl-D-glutamate deacylase
LNEESFKELRAKDPGATIVLHFYELPRDQGLLEMSVLFPGGIIASDSMPWLSIQTGQEMDEDTWPMPADAFAHPVAQEHSPGSSPSMYVSAIL